MSDEIRIDDEFAIVELERREAASPDARHWGSGGSGGSGGFGSGSGGGSGT